MRLLVALAASARGFQRSPRRQRPSVALRSLGDKDGLQRRRLLVASAWSLPLQQALVSGGGAVAASAGTRVICDSLAVAATDTRSYRVVELASGMRALLVSDAAARSCAAAVDVHVGHMSDPARLPGLAHFCEHMLFLGSAKYPGEDDWETFVSDGGGSSNAYTDTEDTCYFWDLPDARLLGEALERWGPFFGSPLFATDATRREVEAINSEHGKNLKSDAFRVYQLEKSLFPKAHPFSKFGTGNRTTLRPPDGTGEPPRDALVAFYDEHYVGDAMAAVVCGSASLDALTSLAEKAFGGVRRRASDAPRVASLPSATWLDVDCQPDAEKALVVASLASQRAATIKWILPFAPGSADAAEVEEHRLRDRYGRPDLFLSHVLGHEGTQSLLADLRRRGLASGLGAGGGEDTDQFKSFDVSVDLTPKGLKEWRFVVDLVLGYVDGLGRDGQWPDHVFDETDRMANLAWTWGDAPDLSALATGLAPKLNTVAWSKNGADVAELLKIDRVPRAAPADARRSAVLDVLARIRATRPLVTVLAPEGELSRGVSGGAPALTEPIYGTRYYRPALDLTNAVKAGGDLFPAPNAFVPVADLVPLHGKKAKATWKDFGPPRVLDLKLPGFRLWHKEDDVFGLPRAAFLVLARTDCCGYTPSDVVHARVWRSLVNDALRDADVGALASYDAALAGLEWTLGSGARGVSLSFGGFDAKLPAFAVAAAKAIRTFDAVAYGATDDGAPLKRVLDAVDREIARDAVQPPSGRCVAELGLLTERPKFDVPALKRAVDGASLASLKAWLDRNDGVWGSARGVEVLAMGNVDARTASALAVELERTLAVPPNPEPLDLTTKLGALEVPLRAAGALVRRTKAPTADESNYGALLSFQTGTGTRNRAKSLALNALLEAPFYDELRTKRQLGYVVQSAARARENSSSVVFLAQSNKDDDESRGPEDLYGYISTFLETTAPKLLRDLDQAKLAKLADGIARTLEETPKTLANDVQPKWEEIVADRRNWDRRLDEAKALRSLKPDDVRTFFDAALKPGGADRRPLLVLVDKGTPKRPNGNLGPDDAPVPDGFADARRVL